MLSHIEDEELRSKLENVVYKYTNVFSTELSKTTALVEPSSIPLKPNNEWMTDRSKHPPRRQKNNCLKTREIEKFFRKAIACNIIRPSDEPTWSQILLTPKKNGTYRLCVDFRTLNNATRSSGWPLPNIIHVLDRLSKKKPKHFTILEMYLDDILIFAETKDELVMNTNIVLERLKKYNITVNPQKVKMGLTEVEYIGHLIDKHGISFTQRKKDKALEVRLPGKRSEIKASWVCALNIEITSRVMSKRQPYSTK